MLKELQAKFKIMEFLEKNGVYIQGVNSNELDDWLKKFIDSLETSIIDQQELYQKIIDLNDEDLENIFKTLKKELN